ncbi:MAG TPA: carboxypeptidase regulatory-like domain-containing protein [Candidatus Sulfotelmatobacter sp.]|nr:carboxypeptidase regulatory-like domain-containing protein [Candidatus Sulfotelmatobacter sp.]
MKGNALVALFMVLVVTAAAKAGTIKGKVSGVSGESVIYLEAASGRTFPAPTAHATMDQKGLLFQPHILVVQQGTTVEFQNSDTVAHNVAWSSVGGNKKLAHNMGTWPKGEMRSFKFDNPGAIPLMCYVHPEMSAYVLVSPTPYFATTDKSGEYRIDNVSDGSYTVTAWNEGAKGQSKPVTVSGETTADFTLTKLIR